MYISVRRYTVADGHTIKDISAKIDASFVPKLRETSGFITYYVIESAPAELTS